MDRVVIGPSRPVSSLVTPALNADRIDIWLLAVSSDALEAWGDHSDVLSADERQRSASYLRDEDRARFIIGRAGLRTLLASYLGVDARTLSFAQRPGGKPIVAAPRSAPGIEFSVSHAAGLVACAIGCERDIGIDVEHIPRLRALTEDARVFLSREEEESLSGMAGAERERRLSEYWTLKEAFVKATGEGLRSGLTRLTFQIPSDLSCRSTNLGGADPHDWEFRLLRPLPEYTLALCAARREGSLHLQVREFVPTEPRKKSAV